MQVKDGYSGVKWPPDVLNSGEMALRLPPGHSATVWIHKTPGGSPNPGTTNSDTDQHMATLDNSGQRDTKKTSSQ